MEQKELYQEEVDNTCMLSCILVLNRDSNENNYLLIWLEKFKEEFVLNKNAHTVTLVKYWIFILLLRIQWYVDSKKTDHNVYRWTNLGQPFFVRLQKPKPIVKTDMAPLWMVMSVYELQAGCYTPKGSVYQNCQCHDHWGLMIGDDHIHHSGKNALFL